MQVDSLKDKVQRQEQRVANRDARVAKLLRDIKALIPEKIEMEDSNENAAEQPQKSKELVYEQILALFQRQNNVILISNDRVKFLEQEKAEAKD